MKDQPFTMLINSQQIAVETSFPPTWQTKRPLQKPPGWMLVAAEAYDCQKDPGENSRAADRSNHAGVLEMLIAQFLRYAFSQWRVCGSH